MERKLLLAKSLYIPSSVLSTQDTRVSFSSLGLHVLIQSRLWEMVKDRKAWHAAVHGVAIVRRDVATEEQSNPVLTVRKCIPRFGGIWGYNPAYFFHTHT